MIGPEKLDFQSIIQLAKLVVIRNENSKYRRTSLGVIF